MLEKKEAISQEGNTFYEFLKKQNTAFGTLLEKLDHEVICNILSFLSIHFVSSRFVRVSKFWHYFCSTDPSGGLWVKYSYPNQTLQHGDRAKFIKRELQREFNNSTAYWRYCLSMFNWPTLLSASFTCPYPQLHPHLKISSKTHILHIGNANGNTSARTRYGFSVANTEYAPSAGFVEFKIEQKSRWNIGIGLAEDNFLDMPKRFIGMHTNSWSYSSDGKIRYQVANKEAKQIDLSFEEYASGDTVGLFVDLSANAVTFFKNGHSLYTLTNVISSDYGNNSNNSTVTQQQSGVLYPTVTLHAVGDSVKICTEKITLTPFKMLELVYRADIAMKQKELQNQLRAKLNRLNIVKDEYAKKKSNKQKSK